MSSHPVPSADSADSVPVAELQQTPNNRKRHLSHTEPGETSPKKVRIEENDSESVLAEARRSLYGKTPASKARGRSTTVTDTEGQMGSGVMDMLRNISGDIKGVYSRIEQLENSVDTKQKAINQLETRLERNYRKKLHKLLTKDSLQSSIVYERTSMTGYVTSE